MNKICILSGDGVGPEVTEEAVKILKVVAEKTNFEVTFEYGRIGGEAIDNCDTPLPEETLSKVFDSDAVLLGAVGGPKWDDMPQGKRPETGLLSLRQQMGVTINLRPMKIIPSLKHMSPLKRIANGEIAPDIMIVRELASGIYFGKPRYRDEVNNEPYAVDTLKYSRTEVTRAAKAAFELAEKRTGHLTSVDKANVLESSRLWRDTVKEIHTSYPNVSVEDMYVDNCAMQLVNAPENFDVMLTTNMFGDILSDLASVFPGSIGLMPSASLGDNSNGLFEPVHGSAPDISGQGLVNPVATILSAAMLLRETLHKPTEANLIEEAVDKVLSEGYVTKDISYDEGKLVTTGEMGNLIASKIVNT